MGRAGLGVDERERREREAAAEGAEQAQRRHRHHHHHEQVEQGPARDPRRLRPVHARGVQQAPAGRQLERGREPVEVGVPAHRGEPARAGLDAAVGLERDGAERQLDTGECQPRPLRHGLVHAVHGGAPERGGEAHLEPRGAAQLAVDAVGHGGAAAVEVEMPRARERELVGPAARVSAPLLDEAQLAARLDAVRRQRAPLVGQLGLRGIHRRGALDLDQAERGLGLERPHLGGVPVRALGLRGQRQLRRRAHVARRQHEQPVAGPHLHAQATVRFEARGQRPGQAGGHEAVGQRAAELLVARRARHAHGDARLEHERDLVRHAPVHLDLDVVFGLALRGLGRDVAQPEPALGVAAREGDGRAVHAQRDHAGLGGHRKDGRQRAPHEAARNRVHAAREPDGGPPVALEHRRARARDAHVLGPALGGAGQPDVALGRDEELLHEAAAGRVEGELEPARPHAVPLVLRVQERAGLRLVPAQHPVHPGAQRLGHVFARERRGRERRGDQRRAKGQGERAKARHEALQTRHGRTRSVARRADLRMATGPRFHPQRAGAASRRRTAAR